MVVIGSHREGEEQGQALESFPDAIMLGLKTALWSAEVFPDWTARRAVNMTTKKDMTALKCVRELTEVLTLQVIILYVLTQFSMWDVYLATLLIDIGQGSLSFFLV